MNSKQTPQLIARDADPTEQAKKPYQTPVLKEHGHAKDITLQTFFGTFSPPVD